MKACSSGWSNSGHVCANLRRSRCILGTSFSILEHFTQCWGSLEASRGGMLEVIGAVGSRSGLCWRLCCCYVTCFADMLVHLAAFFSAVWLGQVVFCVVHVKHKKHEKWGPTSEERWFWQFSLSFLFLCLMKASSSGCLNSGHVCANLRRSWCILGTYPVPCWHVSPNVGALLRLLVEVCWKWVGLWGLDQGYVEGFAAVTLLVLRPRWSTWLLFSLRFDLGRWSFA